MARSVDELRREAERSRAALAATVDQLRDRISDTAEDIRHKVSPQHIRAEVSDYISHKKQSWLGALKQKANDNPMQALAAGTAVAVPILRLARGFPLPLLMIGAGLALSSKTLREGAAEAAAPAMDKTRQLLDDAAERAQALRSDVNAAASSTRSHVTGMVDNAQGAASDLRSRAPQTANTVTDKVRSGVDAARDTIERARATATDTATAARDAAATVPAKAGQAIGDNAALIGGLGIAIGAIIAAALPETNAEARVMGQASDSVKRAAGEAAQSGVNAVKETTLSAADAAAQSVADADLGRHASRMTQSVADKIKEAADDVVTAAVNPSQNSNI